MTSAFEWTLSAANTPKTQIQSTRFFSCAANAEYAKMGQQIHRPEQIGRTNWGVANGVRAKY
jgi:hypothetical protein